MLGSQFFITITRKMQCVTVPSTVPVAVWSSPLQALLLHLLGSGPLLGFGQPETDVWKVRRPSHAIPPLSVSVWTLVVYSHRGAPSCLPTSSCGVLLWFVSSSTRCVATSVYIFCPGEGFVSLQLLCLVGNGHHSTFPHWQERNPEIFREHFR